MEQVTLLRQNEAVRLDPDRLEVLVSQMGQGAAEDVMCRALEELAARLGQIERSHRDDAGAEVHKNARGLAAIADQLGMSLLARVARDVAVCVDMGDAVAQAATLARLLRIGEGSLTEVWDLQQL